MGELRLIGLELPEVGPGDDLVGLVLEACNNAGVMLEDGDVLVLTSKAVSKAFGLLVRLDEVRPGRRALGMAAKTGLDPRFLEVLLRESDEVLAAIPFKRLVEKGIVRVEALSRDPRAVVEVVEKTPVVFLTRRDGMLWTDSGIDSSNHPPGVVSIPPRSPDHVARRFSMEILERTGKKVAVVICDTELLPWGAQEVARGCHGIPVLMRRFGEPDRYGKRKFGGADNIANAICSAAGLLMGQLGEGVPAVILKGYKYDWSTEGVKETLEGLNTAAGILETLRYTLKTLGPAALLRLLGRS